MSYLLNTHAFLWYIDGKSSLSTKSREIIENPLVAKYLSVASLWEIAIKTSKDKLILTRPFDTLPEYIDVNGFVILPIQVKHLFQLQKLQHHHGDPFDRLLIAQAISEDLTLILLINSFMHTRCGLFGNYQIQFDKTEGLIKLVAYFGNKARLLNFAIIFSWGLVA